MNYVIMELWAGIWILIRLMPLALLLCVGVTIIEMIVRVVIKKTYEFNIIKLVCQYLWILIILSILKITGILDGTWGISSPTDSYISFKLFEERFNAATFLNICLFIPYGFLPVFIFKNISKHWWNGIIIGGFFSVMIEFLQMFIGRFAQVDDVFMNTVGTLLGFLIASWLLHVSKIRHNK